MKFYKQGREVKNLPYPITVQGSSTEVGFTDPKPNFSREELRDCRRMNRAEYCIAPDTPDPLENIAPPFPSTTITSRFGVAGKIVTGSVSANTKALAREWGKLALVATLVPRRHHWTTCTQRIGCRTSRCRDNHTIRSISTGA